jgi:LPXTG-motif cell wall-anchored protein
LFQRRQFWASFPPGVGEEEHAMDRWYLRWSPLIGVVGLALAVYAIVCLFQPEDLLQTIGNALEAIGGLIMVGSSLVVARKRRRNAD